MVILLVEIQGFSFRKLLFWHDEDPLLTTTWLTLRALRISLRLRVGPTTVDIRDT